MRQRNHRRHAVCERRWAIYKDYRTDAGDDCVDTWVIVYATEAEAKAAMEKLQAGQDRSWFDPDANPSDAFLYVDEIKGLAAC